MTAGKYILRSLKYLIKLLVLLALLFIIMILYDGSPLTFDNFMEIYFSSTKGWLFTGVLVIWCAFYPKVEFVTRHMNYDIREGKDAIIKAFAAGQMMLDSEENGTMKFHGQSVGRRLWFLWDDTVTVTPNQAGGFDMEGPRKFVGEAQQRIPGYMEMAKVSPLDNGE